MRDPDCDHCKRALGPLYQQRIKGNCHLPVFTFDLSGQHPHLMNAAQYLLVCVWSLGDVRVVWAYGIENRQATTVLPCLQASFEDLRALTGGSWLKTTHPTSTFRQKENRGVTGVCLGHDNRVSGGVLVVSVINGFLREVCSAKVRRLGEKVGQASRLHAHPQNSSKATYVNSSADVKCSLTEIEVPTVEQCTREDAIEIQDTRELGLGWAWFVNDLRAFLPAWQDMELASPIPEEPITQIDADVPLEPLSLQAGRADLDLDLHSYERPLAVSPFGTVEHVPDWVDTHMNLRAGLGGSQTGTGQMVTRKSAI